jgi:Fe2+ transport system protein FeoA
MMPLELLARDEWAEVVDVSGAPEWVGRMAEMGLRSGTRLRMVQPGCPCLFQMGHSRLSVRCQDAAQVLVQPIESPQLVAEGV